MRAVIKPAVTKHAVNLQAVNLHPRRRCVLAGAASLLLCAQLSRAAPARRIVSVGGALTETFYALDAQSELVGVDTTSLYPAAARALPSVGYARSLSAEGLLSLRPSLVVTSDEAGPASVLRQLQGAGVPIEVLGAGFRFEGVLARTTRLAALCERSQAGVLMTSRLQQEWQQSRALVAALATTQPRVMFVLAHAVTQMRVSGRDTAADAMIAYAGGSNVLASGFTGYKPLTPEAAIAAAPDVILTTDQGLTATGGIDALLGSGGLSQTPAGRARRVVALDALLMLGFGPRMPQAVLALALALRGKTA